ncbi:MAG: hypothetical protein ACJZ8V_07485 [Paracoccaceae bacterium]
MGSVIPLQLPVRLAPRSKKLRIVADKPRTANMVDILRVRSSRNISVVITVPAAVITPRYSANFVKMATRTKRSGIVIQQ